MRHARINGISLHPAKKNCIPNDKHDISKWSILDTLEYSLAVQATNDSLRCLLVRVRVNEWYQYLMHTVILCVSHASHVSVCACVLQHKMVKLVNEHEPFAHTFRFSRFPSPHHAHTHTGACECFNVWCAVEPLNKIQLVGWWKHENHFYASCITLHRWLYDMHSIQRCSEMWWTQLGAAEKWCQQSN